MLKEGDIVKACFDIDINSCITRVRKAEEHPYFTIFRQRVIEAAGDYEGLFVVVKAMGEAIILKSIDTGRYYGGSDYTTDESFFKKVEDSKKVMWERHLKKEQEISREQLMKDTFVSAFYETEQKIYHIGLKR